jgi:hypothetical protein
MFAKRGIIASIGLLAASFVTNIAPASAEWYFFVQNASSSAITSVLVSETGESWGYFDIGAGIAKGEKVQLVWNKSTEGERCNQLIKATFADGTESPAATINFCQDLDSPIVFE